MAAKRTQFIRLRKAVGFTQESLAEALHVAPCTVGHWERGEHEPIPYKRPKLAKLLGITGARLEELLAPGPASAGLPVVTVQSGGPSVARVAGPLGAADTEADQQLMTFLRSWVGTMNRRELLQLLGWVTATAGVSNLTKLNSDEQERIVGAIASPGRVDEQVIKHIQTVYWSCRQQDDALGPQAVLPTVLAQLSLAQSMVADCSSELRTALLSTCGGLSGLAGWLFADSADYGNAWGYFERARVFAHEARDRTLSSFILGRMSHTAQSQDNVHLAIDFAEASRKAAENTDDTLVRVHAASQTARAYAKDGQATRCMRALDQVERKLSIADTKAAPTSLAYFYDQGSLANAKSICFLDLNRPADAARHARNALDRHEESLVRDNAFTMLCLANAQIKLRQVDDAAAVMGSVVEATTQNRSVRLLERLHTTRAALEPWKTTAAVKVLDEQLRT